MNFVVLLDNDAIVEVRAHDVISAKELCGKKVFIASAVKN